MSPVAGLASISLLWLSLALETKLRQEVGAGWGNLFYFYLHPSFPFQEANHTVSSIRSEPGKNGRSWPDTALLHRRPVRPPGYSGLLSHLTYHWLSPQLAPGVLALASADRK